MRVSLAAAKFSFHTTTVVEIPARFFAPGAAYHTELIHPTIPSPSDRWFQILSNSLPFSLFRRWYSSCT